ncbi:MAG TPA: pyruvate ferredoxin oxidoreductase [Euryarchaeota archaeon]|nr:pyruvate synthase subunit PorA [archaeon BMS3Bbin15]HDL16056.1 pyruvate ferredoxin oxidoreductase [Euryarchaeota archaeon]
MAEKDVMHGSHAVAEAVKLCSVDVISAYPITPQTHIVEDLAEMVANGDIDAEYILVESEHSAISAGIGASATGARVFTASSSQGLALMHEVLWITSGMRLPIVMVNANRALSAPINIWNDQSDSMAERDSGWLQIYVETNQEALDTVIQAYKIAENRDVLLPVMVCMDGFVLTHTVEPVEIPDSEAVSKFLPPFTPSYILDSANPITMGSLGDPGYYMELRRQQEDAMDKALEAVEEVDREFREAFGRGYGIIEEYNMEEAEVVLVTLGSVAGTIKEVMDTIGDKKVGLLKIRLFRPFPKEAVLRALARAKVVSVIEKDVSTGLGEGALFSELKGILFNTSLRPGAMGFVVGLGGRDVTPENIEEIVEMSIGALEGKEMPEVSWIGLKGEQMSITHG